MGKTDKDNIEVVGDVKRRSPFEVKNFGIKKDPNKDYRWVDPKRVDERKNGDGYAYSKSDSSERSDHAVITKGGMILMERPRTLAEESQKQKELRTRARSQAVRNRIHEEAESLSSKHGLDLHKLFIDDREDN